MQAMKNFLIHILSPRERNEVRGTISFVFCFLLINTLYADYGGGYAGSGFRYGSNAREFSLAGAIVADKTPGFFAFSNPALIQFTRYYQVGVSFQNMSLDRSIQSFSFSRRLPPNAGVGLAILQSGTENIQRRDFMNQKTDMFSAKDIEGIISFGVAMGSRVALGLNIKAVFTSIDKNYQGNGISADIGFIYKLDSRLHIGGIIRNLNASYNWKVVIGDDERSYEELFPQIYSLGVAYTRLRGISIFLQEDILITPNNDVNYLSIIIFFNADYKKEELNELEKWYIGAKNEPEDVYSYIPWEFFFDAAHNFYSTRFAWGQESWEKGNWANLSRAVCK